MHFNLIPFQIKHLNYKSLFKMEIIKLKIMKTILIKINKIYLTPQLKKVMNLILF